NFLWFRCNWNIWKYTDIHFTATTDVTSNCTTSRFDFTSINASVFSRLHTEFAEVYLITCCRNTSITTFTHFSKFSTFWLQHDYSPFLLLFLLLGAASSCSTAK